MAYADFEERLKMESDARIARLEGQIVALSALLQWMVRREGRDQQLLNLVEKLRAKFSDLVGDKQSSELSRAAIEILDEIVGNYVKEAPALTVLDGGKSE
jgi:hypothetical protein